MSAISKCARFGMRDHERMCHFVQTMTPSPTPTSEMVITPAINTVALGLACPVVASANGLVAMPALLRVSVSAVAAVSMSPTDTSALSTVLDSAAAVVFVSAAELLLELSEALAGWSGAIGDAVMDIGRSVLFAVCAFVSLLPEQGQRITEMSAKPLE